MLKRFFLKLPPSLEEEEVDGKRLKIVKMLAKEKR